MRTPRCRHVSSVPPRDLRPGLGTSPQVLRPKPVKPATDGFEAQTTKPATDGFEAQTTKPFDACHHGPRSPESPGRPSSQLCLRARHLVPVDTVTPVFLRPSMSQVSATTACHPAIWSRSPSLTSALHRSRSISTARPPWPSPRHRLPDPQLGTCTSRTKKHVARHTAVCQ